MIRPLAVLLLAAGPAPAQVIQLLDPSVTDVQIIELAPAIAVQQTLVATAPGAVLRALDRISGITTDLELASGDSVSYARLSITLAECRYPPEDPTSNAYARLTISDRTSAAVAFDGWMVANSPALSALDDPRYDVWLIRCRID
jgi:hypothetical protein